MTKQAAPDQTTTTPDASAVQRYYHLVAGNVVYKAPGADANANMMGTITLNGLILSDTKILGVANLNDAQQVLQHHFRNKTQDPDIEIVDVIILNIVRLGYQSDFEFNNLSLDAAL